MLSKLGEYMDELPEKQDVTPESTTEGIPPIPPASPIQTPEAMQAQAVTQAKSSLGKLFSKRVLIILLIIIVVAGAALAFFLTKQSKNDNATNKQTTVNRAAPQKGAVGLIEGTVEYYNGTSWQAATTATEVKQGDELKTGANARAVVTLDDGSAVRLDANTQVKFTTLSLSSVILDDRGGAVYTRVTPSTQRSFIVNSNEQSYKAMGTAYRTFNLTDKQGVEVFQSTVQTGDKNSVPEGQGFFTKNADTSKVNKVTPLNLEQLQNDTFLQWNKSEDEKDKDFSTKMGVLKDLKNPTATTPTPATSSTPQPTTTAMIKISGSATTDGIKVSWTASGINTNDGYKVVYSTSNSAPKYGTDSAQYVSNGTNSYTLALTDGGAYYIRVCAYRPSAKTCENYSSAIKVTAPKKDAATDVPTDGTISLSLSGTTLSWTYTGTAPYGFKVVYNTTGSPTYPENEYQYLSSPNDTSTSLSNLNLQSGVNYIRVCKYTAGKKTEPCINYSNQITYTKP